MALYKYASSSRSNAPALTGITEFEILKASHKFLRDEDEKPKTWDDQLAGKYYESLYREFAVCDLKHYKSGNFSLRWRTEDEVLSGAGESTCGNTRCMHHVSTHFQNEGGSKVALSTLELPFAYLEQGESKSALVKVVLCGKCVKKLMWKRTKEKEREMSAALFQDSRSPEADAGGSRVACETNNKGDQIETHNRKKRSREEKEAKGRLSRKRRNSHSKSPRGQKKKRVDIMP